MEDKLILYGIVYVISVIFYIVFFVWAGENSPTGNLNTDWNKIKSNVFSPKGIIRFSARKRRNNNTDSNDNDNSSIYLSNDDMVRVMMTVMIVIRITTCMYVSSLNYGVKHVFI